MLLHEIKFDLMSEPDIFGNFERIKMVGINQMYTGGKIQGRKGKRSTPELIVYKNFLKEKLKNYISNNPNKIFDLEINLFYVIHFEISPKRRKDGEIDQTSISDIDGYLKPIQDSFETKRDGSTGEILELGLWKNDKIIKGLLPFVEYNDKGYDSFTIKIYEYEDFLKEIKKILKI